MRHGERVSGGGRGGPGPCAVRQPRASQWRAASLPSHVRLRWRVSGHARQGGVSV